MRERLVTDAHLIEMGQQGGPLEQALAARLAALQMALEDCVRGAYKNDEGEAGRRSHRAPCVDGSVCGDRAHCPPESPWTAEGYWCDEETDGHHCHYRAGHDWAHSDGTYSWPGRHMVSS